MSHDLSLNQSQLRAVKHVEGPLLILAGAGSGKTRVVAHRIAHLIKDLAVSPHQILAVTFTNKAAQEMKQRVEGLLDQTTSGLWIATFHSISVRILRREIDKIGFDNNFIIYDKTDQLSVIKKIMKKLGLDPKTIKPASILNAISKAKSALETPRVSKEGRAALFEKTVHQVFIEYQKELKKLQALDFDDLINKTIELFDSAAEVLEKYQQRFKYIMVDEYQDINYAQYMWVQKLTGTRGNIGVVGDPDQSIYAFRGADISNILNFEKRFPQAEIIQLEENYRSSANILRAAQEVISNNVKRKEKDLWTKKEAGEKIVLQGLPDDKKEAEYVAQEIVNLITSGKYRKREMAILYRINAQTRLFEEKLSLYKIPYQIIGGLRFYDRKEIKDLICYLRFAYNRSDIVALERIINTPRRGIGAGLWAKVMQTAVEKQVSPYTLIEDPSELDLSQRQKNALLSFSEIFKKLDFEIANLNVLQIATRIFKLSGYLDDLQKNKEDRADNRLENIQELFNALREVEGLGMDGLGKYLADVALISDQDTIEQEEDSVKLMTLHTAKGLEFPVVFFVGLEQDLCPHSRAVKGDEIEEERRLCYVGITRAEKKLYLLYAKTRVVFGKMDLRTPSPFLDSIPTEIINEGVTPHSIVGKAQQQKQQKDTTEKNILYTVGKKVLHPKWGEAVIVATKGSGEDLQLSLAFPNLGIKHILVAYVKLQLIE